MFCNDVPDDFIEIANYFEVNYIRGIRARGRRRAVKVRYEPAHWNHYNSVLSGTARTNNASERWHNRFQLIVGRRHPSLFSFLQEIQKEPGSVEYILRELRLGKKVKNLPRNKLLKVEDRIYNVVSKWQDYVDEDKEMEYLKTLCFGHFILDILTCNRLRDSLLTTAWCILLFCTLVLVIWSPTFV